ncbi:RNA polymerase sigma factor [Neolewinella antarctica]|uniref:RNA polymerase sigma factor (Sigma-70 family) n=1 Tax=Neolewinella antarctica TaxID=442734 RepID=A0ABX0XF04_9BACT|nr:sigma-70 family RNA polymerase sigma factor [Neolewinella antarctica]NJC27363.1 RNA polymerase sigma factor (sigma-70 family) [Neolewinella antarctica]
MEIKNKPTDDATLFAAIKAGRHELLSELYVAHRAAFVSYAQRQLYATETDAADCFQDAVIAFYKNVKSGRMTELTCTMRTYLFGIGRRLVYRRNKLRMREVPTDPDEGIGLGNDPTTDHDLSLLNRFEDDHRKALLAKALPLLGKKCQQVLTLFYYHRYPIESVQESLGFSSPGAVRIKKMRCLDKLKKLLVPPV